MKKFVIGLTVVTLLALVVIAYAHDTGWYGAGHRGYTYGYHMIAPGYSGHVRGWTSENDQKFLDETADLRKELNDKKFEYFEAVRNPKTSTETVTKLERNIRELGDKLYQKAPRDTYRGFTRHCWEYIKHLLPHPKAARSSPGCLFLFLNVAILHLSRL